MEQSQNASWQSFQTTQWTLVERLHSNNRSDQEDAISELCRRYWPPVYGFFRRRGLSQDHSAEMTQGFFATVVLHRKLFEQAEEAKGSLRALVLVCLQNFISDVRRHDSSRESLKSEFARFEKLRLAEEGLNLDVSGANEIDTFDRLWAIGQIEESLLRCQKHFEGLKKEAHWELFRRHVIAPTIHSVDAVNLEKIAIELGFNSAAAAAAAIQVVKRRLAVILEQVIAEELDNNDSVAGEIGRLRCSLKKR